MYSKTVCLDEDEIVTYDFLQIFARDIDLSGFIIKDIIKFTTEISSGLSINNGKIKIWCSSKYVEYLYQFLTQISVNSLPVNPNRKVFFVHGTAVKEDENRWIQNPLTKSILLKIAGSDISDDGFHWKAPLTNSVTTREVAAKELQTYIKTNSVGFDEIVIVGHSHGGNVAIQASDYFFFPKRYL